MLCFRNDKKFKKIKCWLRILGIDIGEVGVEVGTYYREFMVKLGSSFL